MVAIKALFGQPCLLEKIKVSGLTVLMALTTIATASSRAFAEVPADFDGFVQKSMKQYNVPGTAVAIVDGNNVIAKGYGVRTYGKNAAVDADTLFMLASNTKPFTAALLAIMVDEKKIGWNDHVIDYLPGFALKDAYATRMTTPKDLLAHRTGLPPFAGDNLEALGFSRPEALRRIRFMEPACSFREKAHYSNPAFFSAGMLAAAIGGDTYEQLIKDKIFAPLSMTRTGVTSDDYRTRQNVADAHEPLADGGSRVIPWDSSDVFGPAGAINSTARDMARWLQLQLNEGSIDGKQVISKESMAEMHTPAMVDEPGFAEMPPIDKNSGLAYGLGWGIYHYKGHVILEKAGARAGMRSAVVLVPDKHLGIAIMANQNLTVLPEAVRAYLIDKMVAPSDTDLQAGIGAANQAIIKMFTIKPTPAPTTAPTLPLANYAGNYTNDLYGTLKVYVQDGKLRWEAGPNKTSGTLSHVGYDTFELAWPPGRISLPEEATFTLGIDGHPTQLVTDSFGLLKRTAQ
jgi:CubicO group peptidase (beta-lactamase class C family)